jgi:phosphoribosylanthranilate isomerase
MIVQIYEIQTPEEAAKVIQAGVHHMGSVLQDSAQWRQIPVREAIQTAQRLHARASLIPLFFDPDLTFRLLDWYQPDIIHFCDRLWDGEGELVCLDPLLKLQEKIRLEFPGITVMRTIPLPEPGIAPPVDPLLVAARFKQVTDCFLTDTWQKPRGRLDSQPVNGFIGITGRPCDWDLAAELVRSVNIPVILAGGISPENAYEAILRVRPAGVDSCTGTNARGPDGSVIRFQKDVEAVRNLVAAVHRAEAELKGEKAYVRQQRFAKRAQD